jgi:hypothetical protein
MITAPLFALPLEGLVLDIRDHDRYPRVTRAAIVLYRSLNRWSHPGAAELAMQDQISTSERSGFLGLCEIVVEPPEKPANFQVELLGSFHAADMTDSVHDDKL